eukprot:1552517-Amphidinium_carterae.1
MASGESPKHIARTYLPQEIAVSLFAKPLKTADALKVSGRLVGAGADCGRRGFANSSKREDLKR